MAETPVDWDEQAHALWLANKRAEAIKRLLIPINEKPPKPPKPLLVQFGYYLFLLPDYRSAANVFGWAHALYAEDMEILLNLAIAQSRAKDYAAAIATGETYITKGGNDPNVFDMLAKAHYRGGRYDQAKAAGEHALAIKDEKAVIPPDVTLRSRSADVEAKRKIIAFSLWGSNPRYLRGALHNVLTARNVYPGWTCRFYVDSSVDSGFREVLAGLGAEILEHRIAGMPQRLSRRFVVADDPNVGRFLVRDCDSVVSEREAGAVDQWIASDKPFHVMRDWWTHTDPVLAGMWGGIAGVLPSMRTLLGSYKAAHLETPNWDQWFLRDSVWPLIRDHALVHDSRFASRNAIPFPSETPTDNTHVGQDEFAVRRAHQKQILAEWIEKLPLLRMPDGS